VFVLSFPSGALAANCYLVGSIPGGARTGHGGHPGECVVIDPGQGAAGPLDGFLRDHDLRPVAVLLTHGHLDHIAAAREVCREWGIPAFLHEADQYMLDDPLSGLSPQLRAGISTIMGPDDDLTALRPDDVRSPVDGDRLPFAGLTITVDHVPGHTGGSVVYRISDADAVPAEHLFTGDTLFAGTIGRTDLPGGSMPQILSSIATKMLTRPDDATVHPGHGPATTIGAERRTNPFL
jgi:hydroxyacylglutathione hydrolase